MSQIIGIFAAAGVALLSHAAPASVHRDISAGGEPVSMPYTTDGLVAPRHRCGPTPAPLRSGSPAAATTPTAPLINDYMAVNGRIFTLAAALGCASRLHAARFN